VRTATTTAATPRDHAASEVTGSRKTSTATAAAPSPAFVGGNGELAVVVADLDVELVLGDRRR
jgi:hypothetical protein